MSAAPSWDAAARIAAAARLPVLVAIAEPPCAGCFHWRPFAVTGPDGQFSGIILCHCDQLRDFSCYYPRSSGAER